MKVLIAIDGSNDSFTAVRQAGQLVSSGEHHVALYYAPLGGTRRTESVDEGAVGRARTSLASEVFAQASEHLPPALRGHVETILGTEDARHGILSAAEDWKANLIAVGARGLNTIKRLLLGSVSHYVAHHAHVPVLIARVSGPDRQADVSRVLAACDGSASDAVIASTLRQLSWPASCSCQVITVVEPMLAGHLPPWIEARRRSPEVEAMAKAWEAEHAAEVEQRRHQVTALARRLPPPFAENEPIVVEGNPAEEILNAIARERAQLVVIAARGGGLLSRLIMGSTSDAVLSHAPCSVLVVRAAK